MEEISIKTLRDKQRAKIQPAAETPAPVSAPPAGPSEGAPGRRTKPLVLARLLGAALFVFVLGGLGGVWLDRFFFPTLVVSYPELGRSEFLKQLSDRTTIVQQTQQITVSQEEAISDVIDKVGPAVMRISNRNAAGELEEVGSGIILTSDGYLITPLKNLYTGAAQSKEVQAKLKNGKTYTAQLIATDSDYNLSILKIEENNLSVTPYAGAEELKLGQKLIVINDAVATDIISKLLDNYKPAGSTDSGLQRRIQLGQSLPGSFAGSAVINLEGKLVGVQQDGNIVIPLGEIKAFIDQSINRK